MIVDKEIKPAGKTNWVIGKETVAPGAKAKVPVTVSGDEGTAGFVVLLYIVLLFRAARIASRCDNNFPAFLVLGLALMLVIQASFNMMVAVGIAPVTGQPLPLISRGGTSTIINCVYIGAILSVSRSAKKKGDKMSLNEI